MPIYVWDFDHKVTFFCISTYIWLRWLVCDNVVIYDNITLILPAWPEFLWRHMRQSVPAWSRILFIFVGNNLNIPSLPARSKFQTMNTKLILYPKSSILNVVKMSRALRHAVSFLWSGVTMAVTRPRFCLPPSPLPPPTQPSSGHPPLGHCWWRWQMLPMSSLWVVPTLSRPTPMSGPLNQVSCNSVPSKIQQYTANSSFFFEF